MTEPPQRRSVAEERAEAQARQRTEHAARKARMAERDADRELPGRGWFALSWTGTAVLTVSALYSSTIGFDAHSSPPGDPSGAVIALVLFGIGCGLFLVALVFGAQRSREAQIGIGGWFFLSGSAPPLAQWHLLGSLVVEVVVSVATAAARPFSTLAFGILVPTYALAICGIWGARHGEFPDRVDAPDRIRP